MGLFDKFEKMILGSTPSNTVESAYPEELERLIEIAIEDGVITPQEKQVLYKKAAKYDIDSDELDMVLASRLRKAHGVSTPAKKNNGIKKCPSCGAVISETNIVHCPDCGYKVVNVVKDLLDALNAAVPPQKNNKNGGLLGKLIDIIDCSDAANLISMKTNIIMSYNVPMVKEAVLEFLAFSVQKGYKDSDYEFYPGDLEGLGEIWYKKSEQVILEARRTFQQDEVFMSALKEHAIKLGMEKRGVFGGLFRK